MDTITAIPAHVETILSLRVARVNALAAQLTHIRATLGLRYAAEWVADHEREWTQAQGSIREAADLLRANGYAPLDVFARLGLSDVELTQDERAYFGPSKGVL